MGPSTLVRRFNGSSSKCRKTVEPQFRQSHQHGSEAEGALSTVETGRIAAMRMKGKPPCIPGLIAYSVSAGTRPYKSRGELARLSVPSTRRCDCGCPGPDQG